MITIPQDTARVRATALPADDWETLRTLPWGTPLEEWDQPEYQVDVINQRRGLSRHPVIFVRSGSRKYAIKETSPEAAEKEIANYQEISRRGCPVLVPVGTVTTVGEPIVAGEINGVALYESGDMGYCITRLATRVLPQSLLYQYPFTDENKRRLLLAIARLMANLHRSGIYWGDASLANTLINLGRTQLSAICADAETVEFYQDTLPDALRESDIDYFVESLMMQSEDIRIARELPEEETVLDEADADYFREAYAEASKPKLIAGLAQDVESAITLMGSSMVDLGTWAWRAGRAGVESTFRPGWYRDQLRDLMGVWIPRAYARRVYDLLLGHKWLMSEEEGIDVGLSRAAEDWRERYHEPVIRLLQSYAPGQPIDYDRYLQIMHHIWHLSRMRGYPIAIEEGAIDYLLP